MNRLSKYDEWEKQRRNESKRKGIILLIVIGTILIITIIVTCVGLRIVTKSINKVKNGQTYLVSTKFINTQSAGILGDTSIEDINSNLIFEKYNLLTGSTSVNINESNAIQFGVLIELYVDLNQVKKDIQLNGFINKKSILNLSNIYTNNIGKIGNSIYLKSLFQKLNTLNEDIIKSNYKEINTQINEIQNEIVKFINEN